ncbi:hypothetical protein U9M48_010559 [Paspalum notatum var. saurae]|uniref:Cathepsin propeptide inhibitor domain-containing protein n=1 Tax=Paspalum notatum var. saurae TaxID=547442 RepID=A0AAQ3WGM1_PASNO
MSDLDIGNGVLAVGGFAAFLYFKEDESALMPDRERNLPLHKDPAIRALFTDEHGNVNWMNYYDFFCFKKENPNLTNEEIRDMVELTTPKDNNNVKTLEDVNESLMMSRFEQWIKQYGRTYKSKEEKARRYEAFKANAIRVDQLNALSQNCTSFVLKEYADWTEEKRSNTCSHSHVDWETVFDMRARLSNMEGHDLMEVDGGERLWTEAMKQLYLKQKAKAAEHTFGAKDILCSCYVI